jgi:pimeloyl-ACP methyl ester carboxylesterase
LNEQTASGRPTIFFLAGLEVSGRLFDAVSDELCDEFDCVVLDLPGFDGTSTATGVTQDDLVTFVSRRYHGVLGRVRRNGAGRAARRRPHHRVGADEFADAGDPGASGPGG